MNQNPTQDSAPVSVLERLTRQAASEGGTLPAYLRYPCDPLSQLMFGSDMAEVSDERCGYQFKLYTAIADVTPEIRKGWTNWAIDETHIFAKPGAASWCSVSTLYDPHTPELSARKLAKQWEWMDENGAEPPERLLDLPSGRMIEDYRRVALHDLGESGEYDRLHLLDESHVYCRVFRLNGELYKKFILAAGKGGVAWRVECTIPTTCEAVVPPDFVPPGQTFGSFFPLAAT